MIGGKIKGYGKITIGDTEIPFENTVNANFLGALQGLVDLQGISRQTHNMTGVFRDIPVSTFKVASENADPSFNTTFTEMGRIAIEDFQCVQASLYKTTIKGSGTFTKSGTVRSAGFDLLPNVPTSPVPYINDTGRRVTIKLQSGLSVPTTQNWVYHWGNKAFYCWQGTDTNIYKIPFDIDTGIIGVVELISTNWTTYTSRITASDGKNKIIRTIANNNDGMRIFDMETETVYDVPLTGFIRTNANATKFDYDAGVLRNIDTISGVEGYTISLDGVITNNTGSYSRVATGTVASTPWYYRSNYWRSSNYLMSFSETNGGQIGIMGNSYGISDGQYLILDDNKTFAVGTFNSLNPTELTLYINREPDTAVTSISIPERNVSIGEQFTVEYVFETLDTR